MLKKYAADTIVIYGFRTGQSFKEIKTWTSTQHNFAFNYYLNGRPVSIVVSPEMLWESGSNPG